MRKLQGVIISNKMRRTATVRVDRLIRHPKYHKYERRSRTFKADTGQGDWQVGDEVVIQETRPLSREKRWRVIELIKRAPVDEPDAQDESQEARITNQGE
ncbi:MAG: 30S ribosomal protein S17 [Patescibacteria group bacterium]